MFKKIFNFLKELWEGEETIRIDIVDSPPFQPHPKYWEPRVTEREIIYMVSRPLSKKDLEKLKRKQRKGGRNV